MNNKIYLNKKKIFLLSFFVISLFSSLAQNDSTYYYFDRVTPIENILTKIESVTNSSLKNYYSLVYYSKIRKKDSIISYLKKINIDNDFPISKKAKLNYFKAYYHKITSNDSLAYKFHLKALSSARKTNDSLTILYSLSGLSQSWDYNNNKAYRLDYLTQLESAANDFNNNTFKITQQYLKGNYYLFRENNRKAVNVFRNLINQNFKPRDSIKLLNSYNSLGVLYEENLKNPDSAIFFYKKKLALIDTNSNFKYPNNYFDTYLNIGNSYLSKKDYKSAQYYYNLASNLKLKENIIFNKLILNENSAKLNDSLNDYKKAYNNLKQVIKLSDSLNKEEHRVGIANIKEQYDNEKLRADNIESKAKSKRFLYLSIIAIGLLFFVGITAFLIQKNTKKKQKLAEQDKALEKQKVATLLKDQEINNINAMIEGQEKERQRIANDLHDDLGGLMATIKLQFNTLQEQQTPDLFNKTNSLLDQAYNKIRSIAHAKNSGVIAKQGLLKAVKNMAHNVSSASTIDIEVTDFGLESRLENSLELSIFRIIQELTTNIIKHADATHATISLTNHENSLNIMIEDNGKGFNANKVIKSNGMGLHSIEKRVEHLEGELKIESQINQGTTIIIDIPL